MIVYCDIEVYNNYFLVCFLTEVGKKAYFDMYEGKPLNIEKLQSVLYSYAIITFNGLHYDLPILQLALAGASCEKLKKLSDNIILDKIKPWNLESLNCKHIDLMQISPGVASLKMYGARLNSTTIQDLPIDPNADILPEMREKLIKYCFNDLDVTKLLHKNLSSEIQLRKDIKNKYHIDVINKSDQQIGENILRKELQNKGHFTNKRDKKVIPFKYKIPSFIKFESKELKDLLQLIESLTFTVSHAGNPRLPEELSKPIKIAGNSYKFGIGGLHSQEKQQIIKPNRAELFGELDVSSMYPSIILEQSLYPKHLSKKFIGIYRKIYNERIAAKKSGDKFLSSVYKLILNSAYGKFGSRYSFLYAPELLIQTTVTGQLVLLMLIEKLHNCGCIITSANTDGINVLYSKEFLDAVHSTIFDWEISTGLNLEWTPYFACYSRDVNNYIAIKSDESIKAKGAYASESLMKNFANKVCIEAVISYLKLNDHYAINGDDYIRNHIYNEKDIAKFLSIRKVSGGAVWKGEYLGKVVRWYYSKDGEEIKYKKSGNKVAKTDECKPMMTLADGVPKDLYYERYVDECHSIFKELGVAP